MTKASGVSESRESRSLGSLGVLGVSGVSESQTVNCTIALNCICICVFVYLHICICISKETKRFLLLSHAVSRFTTQRSSCNIRTCVSNYLGQILFNLSFD